MNQLLLTAYVKPPRVGKPCFVTPVFKDPEGALFLQVTQDRKAVRNFEPFGKNPDDLGATQSEVLASVGKEAVFVFFFSESDVICGLRSQVSQQLRKRLSELDDHPFTKLSVAAFAGDDLQIRSSVQSAFAELSTRNRSSALDWRKNAALTYPFPENPNFTVGWNEFNDFALYLLKFVRSYRAFLHSADLATRKSALGSYESNFKYVLEFLFDSDFLAALRSNLERLSESTAQYSIDFGNGANPEQIRALTRIGLSRNSANRFLTQIRKNSYDPNPTHFVVEDALMTILQADTTIRSEICLARELSRAEKRIKKRDLTIGTISIAYGLVLLLKSRTRTFETAASNAQELAIDAIRAGLKNLAPTSEIRLAGHELDKLFSLDANSPISRSRRTS